MDNPMCVRDVVELEYNGSTSASHSKSSTGSTFPPILQAQQRSSPDEAHDDPSLCKKIVHVHVKASEQQFKLDAAWLDTTSHFVERTVSSVNPSSCKSRTTRISKEENGYVEKGEKPEMMQRPSHPALSAITRLLRQKLKLYGQQWNDGLSMQSKWTVMEACTRLTCSNLIWCLVMGTWLEQKTAKWGIVEMVIANAASGFIFELLGGEATLVVGPSSPCLVFVIAISTTAKRLRLDVVPWAAWIGVWGSLMLLLLAVSNASKLLTAHVTYFSWGVVCTFIRLTFLWGALEQLAHFFIDPGMALDSALLSLWLTTTVFFVAQLLENVRHWQACPLRLREAIADYSPLLVVPLFAAVPLLPKLNQSRISQVNIPELGYHTGQFTRLGCATLKLLPFWAILLAVIPGIMLGGLIFICHNATAALHQNEAGYTPLYKSSQKWNLSIVAFLTFLCSLLGLPYTCGMLYQSHVHVRGLTTKLLDNSDMENQQGVAPNVRVQRMSGLSSSSLLAAVLLPPVQFIVKSIPSAVMTGLLLQMTCQGYASWNLTAFIGRVFNKRQVKPERRASKSAVCVYTIAQISCIFIILIVSKTPAAVMFPLFVFSTLWVRHYAMQGRFMREEFAKLDNKLSKDCSNTSSSGQLSMGSHDMHNPPRQSWPQLTISHSLKSAMTVPMTDVQIYQGHPLGQDLANKPDFVAESGESPLPYIMSPSILSTSSRRLKERSRRRHKRKRQASLDNAEASGEHETEHEPIPPLVQAMLQEETYPSFYEQEEEINLSKRVSPGLSPQFFKKTKQKACHQTPLEVHSNLLYEPKSTGTRQLHSETRRPSHGVSPSITAIFDHNEIQSSNQRQEILHFQGSHGIGRCIRSPPVTRNQSPTSSFYKKKQMQLSLSTPRRRAFPREEIYPGAEGARKIGPKSFPRLRRCSIAKWPTATSRIQQHQQQQQQQPALHLHVHAGG